MWDATKSSDGNNLIVKPDVLPLVCLDGDQKQTARLLEQRTEDCDGGEEKERENRLQFRRRKVHEIQINRIKDQLH